MTGPSLFILSLATPLALCAQAPRPLGDSDLAVGSVEFAQDSSQVRRALGAPVSTDSTKWQYADLRVWFSEGKVHQIEILGRRLATRRGLRIGDKAGRATGLYGPSCVAGAFAYCRTVDQPDARGILVEVKNQTVTGIWLGAVFGLE